MTENGPDVVLLNLIWNMKPLFEQMLEDTLDGTFDAPYYDYGVQEGAMLFTYNEALKGEIPQEAIDEAEAVFEEIKAGEMEVPFVPEGELPEQPADGGEETGAEPDIAGSSLAVVLTGPWDDNSWNEAAYTAAQRLKDRGVETAYSESIAEGDERRVLREYAEQGYQMIVGHSFGFQDGVFEVAGEYPDANFAWAGGTGRTAENVADYDQPFYEAAYPVGVIAGYMTESDVLGALYGFDIPVCHSMGEAFLAGAKSVNPDVELITTATGEWVDVAKNKEAALAQADAGVDFWIECGEGSALGAIEAAKEVGGYTTGYVGDMTENGPDVVLVNVIWNMEPIFVQMLQDTLAGTFDNPFYDFGVQEGAMLYTYNENLKSEIPQEAIDAAESAFEDIKSGELEVPFIPE
jgi:simple sugar transport system substrate-binding protein/basic membrane protein A